MNELIRYLQMLLITVSFVKSEFITQIPSNCTIFCANIDCEPISKCDGFIVEKGSYCGCCNACVKYLDINESCSDVLTGPLLVAQSRCKNGTKCKSGKCVVAPETASQCLQQKNIRETKRRTGITLKNNITLRYPDNIWIPQCDVHGNYTVKQKKMRKSVCVDESGKRIFGSASDDLENDCACSLYMQKKEKNEQDKYNIEPQEHCSPSGSFAVLQCIGNLCYCADNNTGQVKSSLVTKNFLDKLPCYDEAGQMESYLTNCEIELQRTRKLIFDFKKKGITVIGVDRIKCDPDGTFSPVQCTLTNCICTDKEGVGIKSHHPDIEEGKYMTCECAREEMYQHNTMFRCTASGDYHPLTCVDNHCLCVDDDGDIISEILSKDDYENCKKLRQNLSTDQDDNDNTTTEDNIQSSSADYTTDEDYYRE